MQRQVNYITMAEQVNNGEIVGEASDFYDLLYWTDEGNPVPSLVPVDGEIDEINAIIEEIEAMALNEDAIDEGFDATEGASAMECTSRVVPAAEVQGDIMVCSSIYLVAINTRHTKYNLCFTCYNEYAAMAPAAEHKHYDGHFTQKLSVVPRPMCSVCCKDLYTIRPVSVCSVCTGKTE